MLESIKGYVGDLVSPTYMIFTQIIRRRTRTINDTKIKYIKIGDTDKLYTVEKISFYDFSIKAVETDLKISDVPENEIFDILEFKDFRVTLKNGNTNNIVEFPKK